MTRQARNFALDKREYVKREATKVHSGHTCHWVGCKEKVPPALWGCRRHWFALPAHLRKWVWATYKPGQEINKTPSREYVLAARAVQNWIIENGQEAGE